MDEVVMVSYVAARDVYVDGTRCGTTNSLFHVQTGTHRFDLGQPVTYTPPSITTLVAGTSPLAPLMLKFLAEL
jgi:hypothetical protein